MTTAIGFNQHLAFFDHDQDHKISIGESRKGLERLGFGRLFTVPAALAINYGVSALGLVQGRKVSPTNLELPSTGFVRHPDSDLIDDQGEFDDARLDAVFAEHGQRFGGAALTLGELTTMLASRVREDAQNDPKERLMLPMGIGAALVEWGALLWVAGSRRDGTLVLDKDTVRRFYTNPRFFHDVADRIAQERAERSRSTLGTLRNVLQDWLI